MFVVYVKEKKQDRKNKKISIMQNFSKIKGGWLKIADTKAYFRSKWEADFAIYLQKLKDDCDIKSWEHEPKTFWFEKIKRGCVSYKPDFRVIDKNGLEFWIEVKGFLDAKSKTKIKRFEKYFPDLTLLVVDKEWMKKNQGVMLKAKAIVNWSECMPLVKGAKAKTHPQKQSIAIAMSVAGKSKKKK